MHRCLRPHSSPIPAGNAGSLGLIEQTLSTPCLGTMLADLPPSDEEVCCYHNTRQGNEEADSIMTRKRDYPWEHGVLINKDPLMVLYKFPEAFRHRHSAQSQLSIQPAHKHQCLPSPNPGFTDPYLEGWRRSTALPLAASLNLG